MTFPVFLFAADRHFHLSHFHFRLLRRRLTQSAFVQRRRPCATSVLFHRYGKLHISNENATANSLLCSVCQECCLSGGTTLTHCSHEHDLTIVAQLSVINIADIRSAFDKTLSSEHFRQNAVDDAP